MKFTAVLLAGERGGSGPVAEAAGVPCKALAKVGTRPMLSRVLGALLRTRNVENCLVVGNPEFEDALKPLISEFENFAAWQQGEASPARSAARAASHVPADRQILLTTADHPLLDSHLLEKFLYHPAAESHDATVGLVRHAEVMARHPTARCTPLRFSDDAYCGTNLFLFRTAASRRLMQTWTRVEQARKTPWRVISLLGPLAVLGYLTKQLSLAGALGALSRKTGLNLGAAILDEPRAALDVDTVGDWEFAQRLIQAEEPAA